MRVLSPKHFSHPSRTRRCIASDSFWLFLFSLPLQHCPKVVDAGECVEVLSPKHILLYFHPSSMHRFCFFVFSLPRQRCSNTIDGGERVGVLYFKKLLSQFLLKREVRQWFFQNRFADCVCFLCRSSRTLLRNTVFLFPCKALL